MGGYNGTHYYYKHCHYSCLCVMLCYLPQEFPLWGTIKGYCIVLYCIVMYCIALHCIALHCIALHCIALHCIALHCIALHCIALCSGTNCCVISLTNHSSHEGLFYLALSTVLVIWIQLEHDLQTRKLQRVSIGQYLLLPSGVVS